MCPMVGIWSSAFGAGLVGKAAAGPGGTPMSVSPHGAMSEAVGGRVGGTGSAGSESGVPRREEGLGDVTPAA